MIELGNVKAVEAANEFGLFAEFKSLLNQKTKHHERGLAEMKHGYTMHKPINGLTITERPILFYDFASGMWRFLQTIRFF